VGERERRRESEKGNEGLLFIQHTQEESERKSSLITFRELKEKSFHVEKLSFDSSFRHLYVFFVLETSHTFVGPLSRTHSTLFLIASLAIIYSF